MPKVIATHEVDDVDHWLSSPKREEVFAGIAEHIRTFVHPEDKSKVALSMEVNDMDALAQMLESDAGKAAAKYDGVRTDTIVFYVEG